MNGLLGLAGGAIALAGAEKLSGDRGYAGMFRHLGWSPEASRAAAIAETAGGALMVPRRTRRLGGAVVAAVSATILFSEARHAQPALAGPRALVLLSGLAAVFARR